MRLMYDSNHSYPQYQAAFFQVEVSFPLSHLYHISRSNPSQIESDAQREKYLKRKRKKKKGRKNLKDRTSASIMSVSVSRPILICGAGISGLALAQGLLQANIPFRVFERDLAHNIRAQGYRFRLVGTGIDALKQLLPSGLFDRVVATCAESTTQTQGAVAHFDAVTGEDTKLPGGRPGPSVPGNAKPLNVDRTVLRAQLSRGLDKYIEYGREFCSYDITPTGVTVKFSDGSEAEGSLLVGADGSRSRVRRQYVPELQLVDTEGRLFYGKTTLTAELEESFQKEALKGMTLVLDRTHEAPMTLLLEPVRFKDNEFRSELPEDYVYWVLSTRRDGLGMDNSALLNLSTEEAAALAKKLTSDWHPSFHALFDLQDAGQTSLLRIGSVRPDIPVWKPSDHVTIIGDAAHLMSPSAGVGATTALRDAAVLLQILKDGEAQEGGIGKYEAMMREYAGEAVRQSSWGGKMLFGMRPLEDLDSVIA